MLTRLTWFVVNALRTFGSKCVRLRASVLATYKSPLPGRTARLKFTVPTRVKYLVMAREAVSISTTSLSGMVYLITGFVTVHAGSVASTIKLTCGGAGNPARISFVGCGGACGAGMRGVGFPESAKAA